MTRSTTAATPARHFSSASCPLAAAAKKRAIEATVKRPGGVPLWYTEGELVESYVRGGGSGGQAVAKTNNCVILRHTPTGIIIRCHACVLIGRGGADALLPPQSSRPHFPHAQDAKPGAEPHHCAARLAAAAGRPAPRRQERARGGSRQGAQGGGAVISTQPR